MLCKHQAAGVIGGRRTSVIADLVCCGKRGEAGVVPLWKAGVFLLLMALY